MFGIQEKGKLQEQKRLLRSGDGSRGFLIKGTVMEILYILIVVIVSYMTVYICQHSQNCTHNCEFCYL